MKKFKHMLSVIQAAVDNGLELDETDSLESLFGQAEDYILDEEPCGYAYVQCDFHSGNQQSYTFVDEDGYENTAWGDIFRHDADGTYLKPTGKGFTPIQLHEVPADRKGYAYVFDYVVCSNGKVAHLYDYYD